MEIYSTEEQQLDAIRSWFKKNGLSTMWTVVIAVSLVMGYRYWQHHREVVLEKASESYAMMMFNLDEGDFTSVESQAKLLMSKFDNTPYAALAALSLAKDAILKNELDRAKEYLQWVVDKSSVNEFRQVAIMRLARVLSQQQQIDMALKLLGQSAEKANGYYTLQEELKGDLLMVQNNIPEAKEAYQRAWDKAGQGVRPVLRMKLEALGVTVPNSMSL